MARDDTDVRQYQDDLDTGDDLTDPVMSEENDDPTEMFGVPPEEFGSEMDGLDDGLADDDVRETLEDRDEDQNLKDRW